MRTDDQPLTAQEEMSSTTMANSLVWYGSQLQRWGAARTPRHNSSQINFSQVSVLYLVRYGITTPGEIAKIMMVTPRAVTTQVDGLVAKGLLDRGADSRDRRLVRLSLTRAGETISRDIESNALLPLVECIDRLSMKDKTTIARAIQLLSDITGSLRQEIRGGLTETDV